MKIADEVLYVLKEIQEEIKEELGKELSIQEIYEVAYSQFSTAVFAFKKGVEVRLPYFGTFIRRYRQQKIDLNVKLKEFKKTATKEEYKAKKERVNAYNIALSKKRKKDRKTNKISTEDFLKLPNFVKVIDKHKDL